VGKHRLNESETEYPRWYFWTFITLFAALLTVVGSIGFRVAPEDPDYYEQHLTAVTSSCAAPGWVIRPVSAVEVVR
jgi:hypothetical protein